MSEIDLTLALQLQAQFEEELRVSLLKQHEEQKHKTEDVPLYLELHKKGRKPLEEPQQEKLSVSLIDPTWELIDPNPDVHTLFLTFNNQFFWGRLAGVEVRWSPRMTLCAGVCSYEGRGGLCSVRLSLPLLKLRPRKDLVETLLHEMIHAYLFVTANNRDRDGHGPEFHKHMYRINGAAGTNISVYHTFHDEVDVYRQHIWQCNGPCRTRRPYFGLLKRTMNRAPGPTDRWWEQHQQTCGGTYIKIQEPENYGAAKKGSNAASKKKSDGCRDIRNFIGFTGKSNSLGEASSQPSHSGKRLSDSLKEHVPENGLKKKTESGDQHSSSKKAEKQNNIQSLTGLSSGKVNQIKVAGASHSNVHGFGSQPPPQKKQRSGNEVAAGKKSGGKSMTQKNFGGSGTTGLAVRGGGSRTVTVRGKTNTQSKTNTKEHTSEVETSPLPVVFQGQGYSLGGNSSKVSKLLNPSYSNLQLPSTSSESNKSKVDHSKTENSKCPDRDKKDVFCSSVSQTEGNSTRRKQKSLDCYVVSPSPLQSVRKTVRCPVCDASIPEKDINKHLDECVSNRSDDEAVQNENEAQETSYSEILPSASQEVVCSGGSDSCDIDSGQISEASGSRYNRDELAELYPCPVCGEGCSPSTINNHLDTHF